MKKSLLLLVLCGITLFSCRKPESVATTLEGKWRMILVQENISGLTSIKPASIQGDVDIDFSPTSITNGTFTGKTPTNDIWKNTYSLGANRSISIPVLSMTKVMETSWGNEFVNHIVSAQQYTFLPNLRLSIQTADKTLIFRKL